ncbi:hypothetical protein [Nocardioides acrostichi]|uniref:Uncharacterized protein n=1 Tax=Nocardioides acrostichi TaxID=2784339 RepID=A0A930Y784_9ACTN|nr:hypothetical protein [Nocardioides acrostichi]MBF4163145.1 hypothetical protein [Nocardioides acrostichi]
MSRARTDLPASARLAWWGTAWLRGHVVADLVVDEVVAAEETGQATHVLSGLADLGLGGEPVEALIGGLARLRVEGATCLGAAFPAEGDPVGLGGPVAFNHDALEMGEAAVADGIGLVPHVVGGATTWVAHRADRRQLPDVGEADRALRAGLLEATDLLARLDVARWRPELADHLMNLRHREPLTAPPGTPARCVDLADRALVAREIVDLALEDDGGALTLHEAQRREQALVPLGRAARRALVAACSPEVWPMT